MTLWFDDMAIGRIDRYGSKLVERDEVLDFARKFDPQPFHLDDAAGLPIRCSGGWRRAAGIPPPWRCG